MSGLGDFLLSMSDETRDKIFRNMAKQSAADYIDNCAYRKVNYANQDYIRTREKAMDALDDLNMRKLKVTSNEFARFVNTFSQIANVNVSEMSGLTDLKSVKLVMEDYTGMKNDVMLTTEFIKSGIKTYAISTSLAIIPGVGIPAWIVSNMFMKSKANASFNNAKSNMASAEIKVQMLETEQVHLDAMRKLAKQQEKIIKKLSKLSSKGLEALEAIVEKKQDWNNFDEEEKKTCAAVMSLMKVIKSIVDMQIITEDGEIAEEAKILASNENLIELGVV